jgi:hypothetical protein
MCTEARLARTGYYPPSGARACCSAPFALYPDRHASSSVWRYMSRDITLFNDNGTACVVSAANNNYDVRIHRL